MRKKNYIFTNKKHSNRAMHGGYGVTGVLATVYSLIGLILGVLTLRDKDIYRFFPVLGTILNVISLGGISFLLYLGSRL